MVLPGLDLDLFFRGLIFILVPCIDHKFEFSPVFLGGVICAINHKSLALSMPDVAVKQGHVVKWRWGVE